MALLSLNKVTLGFGGFPLLEDVDLQIQAGERIGLLGRNGAGKSTLMRVIDRRQDVEAGELRLAAGARVAHLIQEVPTEQTGSSFRVVAEQFGQPGALLGEFYELSLKPNQEPERYEKIQFQLTEGEHWHLQAQIEKTLSLLDLDPLLDFQTLSSGLKRRVLLARALVGDPDLLLLDEPTNHMDIKAITGLEELLLRRNGALLFTTHDRTFLQRLATRILDLDRGRLRSYQGSYDKFLERKAAVLEAEATENARFDKKLAEEEVWIRKGIKARRTRNEGRVRELVKMREERSQRRERTGRVKMLAQEAERGGRRVVKAQNLRFSRGDKTIIADCSTHIMRGDKVGIIGPNGIGKTTLLNLLLGELEPDAGTIQFGARIEPAYFDQLRAQLDEDKSVADNIAGGAEMLTINGNNRHVLGYLQDFLFTPERARRPIHALSGGERNRLLLARLFAKPSNVLVLDEPTNDLDTETLELLEELIYDYDGTVLVVSHDRSFLNNVVTSTLVFEGQGKVKEYVGGYDDWLRQRPEEAAPTKPIKTSKRANQRPKRKRKLSDRERRELEGLPEKIESLEAKQAEVNERMADPELYKSGGGAKVAALREELEVIEGKLAKAYERWEALELIKEGAG